MATDVTATLRKALTSLQAETARIDRQIAAIQTVLASTDSRRRGRTRTSGPLHPTTGSMNGRRRRRRRMSAAARKAVGQRMKAYWAARRKAEAAKPKGKAKKTSRKK